MEVMEVTRFLTKTVPFGYLDQAEIARLAHHISVYYFQAQQPVEQVKPRLMIVRSGVFALYDPHQQLLGKLQEGDFFGQELLLSSESEPHQLVCEEDGLVYWLDADPFHTLLTNQLRVADYFHALAGHRLHRYEEAPASFHLTLKVNDVISARKVLIAPHESIVTAAQRMTDKRVSTLLVEENGQLAGLLTDRDLRSRALAKGVPGDAPVSQIMTRSPHTTERSAYLYEAIQTMAMHNVHHLPVLDGEQIYGMLSITDIIRVQQDHPVYLIGNIHRQPDLAGLVNISKGVVPLMMLLGRQRVPALEIGQIMTTITDALTKRLIFLAQEQLGAAPCEFCWVGFGSQARMDQSLNSDQDNALILAEEPRGAIGDYFARLAAFVCEGLGECGIRLCPGNIMASNPALRLSQAGWQEKFIHIVSNPTPESVLQSSIFFDLRAIDGQAALAQDLHQQLLPLTRKNTLFQFHLAQNALRDRAPLGLFKGFVLTQEGEQHAGCDLKKNGTSLITDIARILAYASGISEVNTRQRLQALNRANAMDEDLAQNLLDAFDLIAQLRWEKHQQDIQAQRNLSNILDPASLHNLQRHQLRDSFEVINRAQAMVRFRFCRGL